MDSHQPSAPLGSFLVWLGMRERERGEKNFIELPRSADPVGQELRKQAREALSESHSSHGVPVDDVLNSAQNHTLHMVDDPIFGVPDDFVAAVAEVAAFAMESETVTSEKAQHAWERIWTVRKQQELALTGAIQNRESARAQELQLEAAWRTAWHDWLRGRSQNPRV